MSIPFCPLNASWNKQGSTVAGFASGISSVSLGGLNNPRDFLVDDDGNLHILDTYNNRIVYWPANSKQGQIVAGDGASVSITSRILGPSMFVGENSYFLVDCLDDSNI